MTHAGIGAGRAATILVVDDNQIMRKMVRLTLEAEGHTVMEAGDGATTLKLLSEVLPDIVLQDLLLPDMDGFELLAKVRELPGCQDLPILAFSGFLSKLEQSRSMQAGFTDHLFKPVEPSLLVQTVEAHLPVKPSALAAAPQGPRVLVADDDNVQRKLLQFRLEQLGYRVEVARDGNAALAQAKRNLPDAIVSDVLMPGLDGFRLCMAIRGEPELADVPVILMSAAYTEDDDRELARSAGANDLVLHTPGLDEIVEALQRQLASKPKAPEAPATAELPLEDYTHRVIRQLERQVGLNFSLSRRLSMLEARFSVLASLAKSLHDTAALDSVLDEILSGALDAFAISKGLAYLQHPSGTLQLRGQLGFAESLTGKLRAFFGFEPLLRTLIEDGRPMALVEGQVAFTELHDLLQAIGSRAMLIAPIVLFDEVLGVLVTASDHTDLGDEWIPFAQALGAQIGQAIGLARALSDLKASEERYRTIVETANEAIVLLDEEDRLTFVNGRTTELLGYTAEELVGHPIYDFVDEKERLAALRRLTRRRQGARETYDARFRRKDGSEVFMLASASPLHDAEGNYIGALGLHSDVTDRKRAEEALTHQALHDNLTGLPNRVLLQELLQQAILTARRDSQPLALAIMDLDRFKDVNDAYGHHFGDGLLKEVAPRLRTVLRESDTVARLGGDEFAIILPAVKDAQQAAQTARKLLGVVNRPFLLEGRTIELGASLGLVLFPEQGEDAETLLRRADVAVYTAKEQRGSYALYSPEQDQHTATRLMLTSELRRGIEQGELRLYYQPKVHLRSGKLSSVEALVRWQHPERGFMPPDSFIPLAEQTGLIEPMTRWVMEEGLRQCHAWKEQGLRIPVAINESMRNLYDLELPDRLADALMRHELEPSDLTIEVTESMIMADPTRAMEVITALNEMGIALSIDDFGTGYSSLAYLKRLPVTEIKVDKSFVLDMVHDDNDATIVRSTIDLAHNLGLAVVAEGVETADIWASLARLGCDLAQGYYLSKPMPADHLGPWLQERGRELVRA